MEIQKLNKITKTYIFANDSINETYFKISGIKSGYTKMKIFIRISSIYTDSTNTPDLNYYTIISDLFDNIYTLAKYKISSSIYAEEKIYVNNINDVNNSYKIKILPNAKDNLISSLCTLNITFSN